MSNEFMREERYIVFKLSDLGNSLKGDEIRRLAREYEEHRQQLGKPPLECVVVESDWPEYEPTWSAIDARVMGVQPAPNAVAYLDLGVGGYMDVGTDLTDEELAALPKGRHMLGIVGTYGIEGYVPAQPAQGEEARLVSYHPDGDTCTLNINGVEMYYDRVDRNTQPAPSMADVDYLVDTLSKFADHHVEHGRMSFDKWTLRSAVEAMLAAAPEAKP